MNILQALNWGIDLSKPAASFFYFKSGVFFSVIEVVSIISQLIDFDF